MIDLVVRVQKTSPAEWLVQVESAQARVPPLTDRDLADAQGRPSIHDHLIRDDVARYVATIESKALSARIPLRYVFHVFEGEEDELLRRLPFELLHRQSFWQTMWTW